MHLKLLKLKESKAQVECFTELAFNININTQTCPRGYRGV